MKGEQAHITAQQRVEMEAVNLRQKAYYDEANGSTVSSLNSMATNLWRVLRQRAVVTISKDVRKLPYDKHRAWLGDLSDKKVLELGCGTGTMLSSHLVAKAKTYHAIDLAEAQVAVLRERYGHVERAAFFAEDFLSDSFTERGYDVVYAHSVLHHFRYMGPLFARLEEVLAPGGVIVTLDPAQAWLPARLFRAMFRPFQTDAAWEFPFGHAQMNDIEARFDVVEKMGIFGRAKWAWVLGMISPALGKRYGDTLFRQDFETNVSNSQFRRCLVVSYLLRSNGAP